MSAADLLEAWRDHLANARRRSEHTVRAYLASADRLLKAGQQAVDHRAPEAGRAIERGQFDPGAGVLQGTGEACLAGILRAEKNIHAI